jgi:hypothetical protein
MSIKERFYQNLQEAREPKDSKERRQKVAGHSSYKAVDAVMNKHDEASGARKRYIKNKNPEDKKKADKATKEMSRQGTRARKLDKIAKGKSLEEEQLDELGDPTHMSYRAKARNQLDKMVNRLGSKMGSDTVNTKKMKNRAEGIKKSYKLQPKKKMNEEEQLDTKKKYKKDKLFLRSRKMIAISKLDRNRKRNKDNRQD